MVALAGYDVRDRIGRGGASVVHEATQLSLDRAVALKILLTDLGSDDEARRFRRERELLSRLGDHRHVVDVYDAGVSPEGRPFIVMRLCRRGSLAGGGARDLAEVVEIVGAVASALQFAHGQGVIHRDVKPANILLADDGTPMLADFGIAAMIGPDGGTSSAAYTAVHAAPEVVERNAYSPASDVYSLASTAWVLLAGRDPFPPTGRPAGAAVPDLDRPGLPPAVYDVLARGMAWAPQDRFTGAQDFAFALAVAAQDAVPAVADPSLPVDREVDRDRTGTGETVETVVVPVAATVVSADESLAGPVHHESLTEPMRNTVPTLLRRLAGRLAGRFADRPGSRPGGRAPRSGRARVAVAAVPVVVVVLAVSAWTATRNSYTVVAHDGQVSLRHGTFGARQFEDQGIGVSDLRLASRRRLSEGIGVDDRAGAAVVVAGLRAEQQACRTSVADGCPPGPLFRPKTFTATPLGFPHGDQLRVTWTGLDVRPGVRTQLAVDGVAPRRGTCEPVLTGASGSCVATLGYGRTWALTATVTGPLGTRRTTARAGATTVASPVARVLPGRRFQQGGTTYCSPLIEVSGFPADTGYRARLSATDSTPTFVELRTDARGRGTTTEADVKYGYREDRENPIAVDLDVGGFLARAEKWRC